MTPRARAALAAAGWAPGPYGPLEWKGDVWVSLTDWHGDLWWAKLADLEAATTAVPSVLTGDLWCVDLWLQEWYAHRHDLTARALSALVGRQPEVSAWAS